MQYKKHPIDRALEALKPIIAPSFTLRSYRDKEYTVAKYPLIDYAIVGTPSKSYDSTKNVWRTSYLIVLEILVQEKKPLDWCQFTELQDAQDRHALYLKLETIVEQFLVLLTNPKAASNLIRPLDMIYSDLDFKLEGAFSTQNLFKHGQDETTGIAANITLSCLDDEGGACCLIDMNNTDQVTALQSLTEPGSVTWNLLGNAGGNPPLTPCDLIKQKVNKQILLYCLLELYNFSDEETQDALNPQQILDLKAYIVTLLVFTIGFDDDFNLLSPTQKADLSTRLCGATFDYSFQFNGLNSYIRFTNANPYNFEYSNAHSVFVWGTVTTFPTFTPLFTKINNSIIGIFFALTSTGKIRVLLINSIITAGRAIEVVTVNSVSLATFQSYGYTYDGSGNASGVRIYLNGVNQAVNILSATISTTILNSANVEIGAASQLGVFGNYSVNSGRVWNIALSPTDAATEGTGTGGKPNANPVQLLSCVLDTDNDISAFGLDTYTIPDKTNATDGGRTINVLRSSRFVQP